MGRGWMVVLALVLGSCGDDGDGANESDPEQSCRILADVVCSATAMCGDTLVWPTGPMSVPPETCEEDLATRCPAIDAEDFNPCSAELFNALEGLDAAQCADGVPMPASCEPVYGP